MALADWLKFAALMDIILFLWYLRVVFRKNQSASIERIAQAMHFRGANNFLRAWWATFLISVSWRFGAGATSSPEAIAYGMFPTLMLAMLLIELADCKLKALRRESLTRSAAYAREQVQKEHVEEPSASPTHDADHPNPPRDERPMPAIRVPGNGASDS